MVEHIFKGSRFLVLVTVLVCAIAALLLYAASGTGGVGASQPGRFWPGPGVTCRWPA